MAFDVYPLTHNAPFNVPASSSSTLSPVQERRSVEAIPQMYVRVAAIGAVNPPAFQLAAGAGDAVPVPSAAGIWDQPGGPGHGNYVGDSFLTPEANGVFLITVLFNLDQVPPVSTWALTIQNNDAAARDFTIVVADSNGDARQPWITMDTAIPFDALITETGALSITVLNHGTGPLTSLVGTLGGPNAASFTVTVPGAVSIDPGGTLPVPVTLLAVASPQTLSATLTVNSNDTTVPGPPTAGHNNRVALSASIGQLEIAFMLDASGSMALGPDGNSVVAIDETATRWWALKSAAAATLTMLANHADGKGNFAVGMYPDIATPPHNFPPDPNAPYAGPFPVPSPSAADFQAPMPINAANITSAISSLDQHFTRENGAATPMGAGIGRAIGLTAGAFGYFGSTNLDLNRRWLILMTDGNHNSGPPDPADFFGAGASPGQGFVPKKIRAMTLGYGNQAAPVQPVNTTLLQQVATNSFLGSSSNYHFAQADATPNLTRDFIKSLLLAGLTLDTISDPSGVLTLQHPTVVQHVSITGYDQKLSFVVSWMTFNQNRLRVEVRTPLGELIEHPGGPYVINANPRFRMLTFDEDFIRNAEDPKNPRVGTWTLIITLNPQTDTSIQDRGSEPYDYQIVVDSGLRLRTHLDRPAYAPGDTVGVSVQLTVEGRSIPDADVTLSVVSPATAHRNFLALSKVTAAEFNRVLEREGRNPDMDSLGIKQIALHDKGVKFAPVDRSSIVKMSYDAASRSYVADIDNTPVTGTYQFRVSATGALPDGLPFRREQNVSTELTVRPLPVFSVLQVDYAQIRQEGHIVTRANMTVRPQDKFGNAVVIDPRFDSSLAFAASGARFQGPIVDNHDGSYSRALVYPTGQVHAISVTVNGEPVVKGVPLVNLSDLKFVDKVLAFKLGHEAGPGANKHRDPKACLGDFTTEESPAFVSLGGGGVIVVGFAGHYVAGGLGDDITVFVHPDQDYRPYAVDVMGGDMDEKGDWVEIGRSPGVTQSFNLKRKAGVPTTRAIRIRDLSQRVRNQDHTPSETPGVSLLGVGAKHLSAGKANFDASLTDSLKRIGFQPLNQP